MLRCGQFGRYGGQSCAAILAVAGNYDGAILVQMPLALLPLPLAVSPCNLEINHNQSQHQIESQ